ncbi:MAG: type IV conjugative transfer system protein TraV [Betaproteobacteria bacterium]|nr:MAG: type IV conjugative transfer system protein TraV [Betaproteobacteria bacterium]
MTIPRTALAVAASLALAGCASTFNATGQAEFACKAQSTDGVRCMSARELYAATEQRTTVASQRSPDQQTPAAATVASATSAPVIVQPSPTIELERPIPIRSQAKVMRIWIAPWEDQHGDLHASGLVFTEIEARRWNLGERMVAKAPVITPLQVTGAATPRTTPPNTSSSTPSSLSGMSVGLDTLQPNAATEKSQR